MKKVLLKLSLVSAALCIGTVGSAQLASVIPESLLPTTSGSANPVLRPQNAASSTMQQINFPGYGINNLYVHSWDEFSHLAYHGIAWRRTDASGSLLNDGYLQIKYANDIDIALYQDGSDFFVLAAYYYDDGSGVNMGHYYDIYKFGPGGLSPLSTMNLLLLSSTFGRINVDANSPYGLAITWSRPGTGIFVKAASLPGAVFGPTVLLPGTSAWKDPDVCIRRGGGGSGSGLDLELVYLNNSNVQIRAQYLNFFTALSGSSAGLTTEYSGGTPSSNVMGSPRIDCPDTHSDQKWAFVYSISNVVGTTITEWTYAVVRNSAWSTGSPTTTLLRYIVYTAGFHQPNNPVLAYDANAKQITVGWITKEPTAIIPGTTDPKYVGEYVKDDGSSAPAAIPSSFMMISNAPAGPAPVLAFSGQNNWSNFDGLHTALSQYNISIPGEYSMNFKDKPWGSSTFRTSNEPSVLAAAGRVSLSVYPVPFLNTLHVNVPEKGNYQVSIVTLTGRSVYTLYQSLAANQVLDINTEMLAPGAYFIKVASVMNGIDETMKIIKQ